MERRSMERFPLELSALITPTGEGNDELACVGTTSNICAGGMYFPMENPLPVSTNIKVALYWPPEKLELGSLAVKNQIKLTGSVVRSDRRGIAISFKHNFKFTTVH
jgi:hypothetical protein